MVLKRLCNWCSAPFHFPALALIFELLSQLPLIWWSHLSDVCTDTKTATPDANCMQQLNRAESVLTVCFDDVCRKCTLNLHMTSKLLRAETQACLRAGVPYMFTSIWNASTMPTSLLPRSKITCREQATFNCRIRYQLGSHLTSTKTSQQ